MTRRVGIGMLFCVLTSLRAVPGAFALDARSAPEYEVKAAFLYHFANFVTWPAAAFGSASAPFVIGVLGDDPFGGSIEKTIRGEKINGRSLVYRHVTRVDEMKACHILFISSGDQKRLRHVLSDLQNVPVLTVGESGQFISSGGMICFVVADKKVGFDVNLTSAAKAGLKLSGRLLKVAHKVSGSTGKGMD
jgi:hypothetical protein